MVGQTLVYMNCDILGLQSYYRQFGYERISKDMVTGLDDAGVRESMVFTTIQMVTHHISFRRLNIIKQN